MYECFHCGHRAVIWDSDFTLQDVYGEEEEGEGLVHFCHCSHCGAEIVYTIRFDQEDIDEAIKKSKEQENGQTEN